MKKILICFILLVSIPVIAQVRLGNTLDSIRKEFSDTSYHAHTGITKFGAIYYAIVTPKANVLYLIDMYSNCYGVYIQPLESYWFTWYRCKYDLDYKIISPVQWKMKDKKPYADIYLTLPDSIKYPAKDGYKPYFIWTFAEKSSIGPSQTAEEYFNSGSAKQDLKDYTGAIADYTKAIKLNPKYAGPYTNRGITKMNLKNYTGAADDFTKVIKLNSRSATAYYNRGSARIHLEDYRGGISDFNKAIKLNPEYSLAYFSRGNAKFGLEQYDDGCLDLKKAAALGYAEATESIKYLCR